MYLWAERSLDALFVRRLVCLSVAFLMLLGGAVVHARLFTPVGIANGLEARVVPAVLLDSKGFLWVGSHEGLFRYDGYQAQTFLPQRSNPGSISDIDIRCLFEAGDGAIWVGTNTGGLDRYDPATGLFKNYRHDSDDPESLIDDSVNGIVEGPAGAIWVATPRGLSRLDPANGQFEHFRHDPGAPRSLANDHASALFAGVSGRLWIGTLGGGVNLWNPDTRDFTRYDLATLSGGPPKRNDVLALHEDERGILWAGTREGLVRLDPEAGQADHVDLGEEDGYPPVITAVQPVGPSQLWLTTMRRGLLIFARDTGEWRRADPGLPNTPGTLPPGALMSLAIGPYQAFIGTWGGGVYRTPLQENDFELINMSNAAGMTNNVISAVMATDDPGQPWLGSYGGGPQRLDIVSRKVLAEPLRRHQMRDSGVMSLAGPADGRLYAATTQGLYEFTDDGIQVALFEQDPDIMAGLGEGSVVSLLRAGDAGLWVGMDGSGLYFFDTRTQSFTAFRQETGKPESLSGNFITALLDEPGGYLWVGTRSNGLNRCRIDGWSCERFSGLSDSDDGLWHPNVTALFRDRRGRVWVGSDGGGLSLALQDQTGRVEGFRHWSSEDGLLNDGIMAIQEDLDESLWLSTRYGLSRLNPSTGSVISYVTASGLPVSHFNTNAASADDRYVYFGSTGGLLVIPKGSLLTERQAPNVRITSVKQSEPGRSWQKADWGEGRLQLPFEHVISVELAVLDFAESANEFAYRLQDSDPWIGLGLQRQILFHGLAPGQYRFQARGRDANGNWGETGVLPLQVVPPFWMTWWFRLLLVISAIFLALVVHFARQARIKRRNSELLRLSGMREHALEEQLGSAAELAVLTPRQKEVLQLLAEGQSTRDIAELLGVSIKTVEAHRANLMERLEIHDLPGLVRLAVRSRLVSVNA